MASLYGMTIKSLKSFEGMDGTAYQGNLYLGNRKIAFWSQDVHGAVEDRVDMLPAYSYEKLEDSLKKVRHPQDEVENEYVFELCMEDLVQMILDEKEYKKARKKGYETYAVVTDGYHSVEVNYKEEYTGKQKDELREKLMKDEEVQQIMNEHFFKEKETVIKIYSSPDDFIIGDAILIEDIKE